MSIWPYQPSPNFNWVYPNLYNLSDAALEQIRKIVAEEMNKVMDTSEDERVSATVEYEQDGKRWRGTVYLVEDE